MEKNEEILDLKTIEAILNYKPELKNNPFSNMDKDVLIKAYKVINSYENEVK